MNNNTTVSTEKEIGSAEQFTKKELDFLKELVDMYIEMLAHDAESDSDIREALNMYIEMLVCDAESISDISASMLEAGEIHSKLLKCLL